MHKMSFLNFLKKQEVKSTEIKQPSKTTEKAVQITKILSNNEKITILKYKAIPPKFLNVFSENKELFNEVFLILDKYYKISQ
jgi:hypothetical protein